MELGKPPVRKVKRFPKWSVFSIQSFLSSKNKKDKNQSHCFNQVGHEFIVWCHMKGFSQADVDTYEQNGDHMVTVFLPCYCYCKIPLI